LPLQNYAIVVGGDPVPDEFDTNVTKDFLVWFEIGFFVSLLALAGALLMNIATCIKSIALMSLATCITSCGQCFGFLMWITTGMVFRWRTAGLICSGNIIIPASVKVKGVLYKSGTFVLAYLIVFCGLCCLGICTSMVATIARRKDKSKRGNIDHLANDGISEKSSDD
jgi:hypothetical protein